MRIHKNVSKVSYETHSVTAEIDGKYAVSDVFDHIIFAVGPGKESLISQGKAYWSEDQIAAIQKNSQETFVVIGTGDGGLIDSLRIKLSDFNERAILQWFKAEWPVEEKTEIERAILEFEGESRITDHNPKVSAFYESIAEKATETQTWISNRIRRNITLHLIGKGPTALGGSASPLNRLLFSCLKRVDQFKCHYHQGKNYTPADIKIFNDSISVGERFDIKLHDNQHDQIRTLQVTPEMQFLLRLGPVSVLDEVINKNPVHREKLSDRAKNLEPLENLDIFQAYDPDIDEQLGLSLATDVTNTSSGWDESHYSAEKILSTRFVRMDTDNSVMVGEHERRGRTEDSIKYDSYLNRVPCSVVDAIATNVRVLLIGDFGSGKSHVTSRLMRDAIKAYQGRVSGGPGMRDLFSKHWKHQKFKLNANGKEPDGQIMDHPYPVRVRLLDFALWANLHNNVEQRYLLLEYIITVEQTNSRREFEVDITANGLLLVLEGWSELPMSSDRVLSSAEVANHINAFLDLYVTNRQIKTIVVITSVREPAQRFVGGETDEERLLLQFERFVVAQLGIEDQKSLIQNFCRRERLPSHAFIDELQHGSRDACRRVAQTPAGLKQLLEQWRSSGCGSLLSTRLFDITLRFIAEAFGVMITRRVDKSSPYLKTLLRLRCLLTRKYASQPTNSRILFIEQELHHAGCALEKFITKGCIVKHGGEYFSVRDTHIQDLIIAWGLTEGDHLRKDTHGEWTTAGVSMLDRLVVVADSITEAKGSGTGKWEHFGSLHIEPLLLGMRLEVDRALSVQPQRGEWQKTFESLIDYLLVRYQDHQEKHQELGWIAALFIADIPEIIQDVSKLRGQVKTANWANILAKSIGGDEYRQLAAHHRRDVGRALSVLGENRPGVSIGGNLLPDFEWKDVKPGTRMCGKSDGDDELYKEPYIPVIDSGEIKPPNDEDQIPKTFEEFQISKYPVTNSQFRVFLEDCVSGYFTSRFWTPPVALDREKDFQQVFAADSQNCPVTSISWDAANAFAEWLSAFTGDDICLPTSWEWEFAAREDQENALFSCGPKLTRYGIGNSQEEGLPGVTAVGLFPESDTPSGLCDMSGTVFEWCRDLYADDVPDEMVTKGGSWNHDKLRCRLAIRGKKNRSERHPYIGFRLVRREKKNPAPRHTVAIVGSGFSGVCTAIRLIALANHALEIVLIEREESFGIGGLAYQKGSPNRENWEHLFNLQALRVSMFRENKFDFLNWLNSTDRNGWPKHLPSTFTESSDVPRCLYHRYMKSRLVTALQNSHQQGVNVRFSVGEVTSIAENPRSVEVVIRESIKVKLACSQLIICTGNLQIKREDFINTHVQSAWRYISDQYTVEAQRKLATVRPGDRILVLGTQLRAFDAVMTLRWEHSAKVKQDLDITLLSRSGRTHRTYPDDHMHQVCSLPEPAFLKETELSVEQLPKLLNEEFELRKGELEKIGIPNSILSERILKAWEQYVPTLLKKLQIEDIVALIRKYNSLITTLRIGVVPQIGRVIATEYRAGRMRVTKGEIKKITPLGTDGPFYVEYANTPKEMSLPDAGEIDPTSIKATPTQFDWIINCMGREKDYTKVNSPLWRTLLDTHVASPHWSNIGVTVDSYGMLVGFDESNNKKSSDWISAVGVMREGNEFERYGRLGSFSFTIGPIKNQALEAAVYCLRRLSGTHLSLDFSDEIRKTVSTFEANDRTGSASNFAMAVVAVAVRQGLQQCESTLGVSMNRERAMDAVQNDFQLARDLVNLHIAKLSSRSAVDSAGQEGLIQLAMRRLWSKVQEQTYGENEFDTFIRTAHQSLEESALVHLVRLDVVQPEALE